MKRLVEQTLDPMVAAYFKNVGQTRTLNSEPIALKADDLMRHTILPATEEAVNN